MRVPLFLMSGLAALAAGPAAAAARDYQARGFDRIAAGGIADVAVHVGPGFAVHATGDQDALDALTVEVRDGALVIGMKPHVRLDGGHLAVAVTAPRLVGVKGAGTGAVTVDRVDGPAFDADMAGTGALRLPAVAVGRLRVAMSGTGAAHLAGHADRIDLASSGTGSIDAAGLASGGGRIDTSGTGRVMAQANGPVDVRASGIGSVTVAGHPACTIHKSGMGSVRCA